MSNDFPKYWTEEEYDPETGEILQSSNTQELIPIEENVPEPLTITEQKNIISSANDISTEGKEMLNGLVEINSIANVLAEIDTTETIEKRKTVVTAWCESFINSRMRNNVAAEMLKQKLLERLVNNVHNLDLQTSAEIYRDLTEVSSVDAQQAMANINGGSGAMPGNQTGTVVNLNLATGENSSVTTNTLNANPQQVCQLKEVAAMNTSIKAWSNVPLPKKKTIDTDLNNGIKPD